MIPPAPTRAAGLARLAAFVPNAGRRYAATRNFDHGAGERHNVSALSPYLRHRLVLETEVLAATLRRHRPEAVHKFIQEVFWRGYFKGWLEHHPAAWTDYREAVARHIRALETDPELRRSYEAATAGATGIECFDHWVQELVQTGYLHNHARMWFASIWVFTLRLPWPLGADLFYRHLLDGDPASNTLSWRWVCGLHTRGKTYLARASNIAHYTGKRFDPRGQLATSAPPLIERQEFAPRPLPLAQALSPGERYGLLLTEEDCCPEKLDLDTPPSALLGAVATDRRSPLRVGRPARNFAAGAVADALERASLTFELDGESGTIEDWAELLAEWAARHSLHVIATAYAPVGPVAELLADAAGRLANRGIRLLQLRRRYDRATWPHATQGFFKLKSKIPGILERLELGDAPARAAG